MCPIFCSFWLSGAPRTAPGIFAKVSCGENDKGQWFAAGLKCISVKGWMEQIESGAGREADNFLHESARLFEAVGGKNIERDSCRRYTIVPYRN